MVLAGALVLGGAAFLAGCSGAQAAPESTFVLLDGSKQTTADLKGKVTLVNFWATSCVTCVAEMPKIIATHNKYKAQGYDTLAVAMSYDPPSYVVNYAQTRQLPFKVAIDNTGASGQGLGRCAAHADDLPGQQARPDRQAVRRRARLCGAAPAD